MATRRPLIKQRTLADFVEARAHVLALRADLEAAQAALSDHEAEVIAALKGGARLEPGHLTAAIKVESRRIVRWRDAYEAMLGTSAAEAVLAATEPTRYERLAIS